MRIFYLFAAGSLVLGSCAKDDPETSPVRDTDTDTRPPSDCSQTTYEEDLAQCAASTSDYQPRENGSAGDAWDACISDDNQYHRVEQGISSIARVEAYDAMAPLLWDNPGVPSAQNFIDARLAFEVEQGLGSRVSRRYDVHYPELETGGCEDEGVPEANPDYCVGPAKLQPVIAEAFADGAANDDERIHPRVVNAAKIEAALQWFFYVSAIKEATTCADKAKDCDSSWAYYCGGAEREGALLGLAGDIEELAPQTHNRAYDALLAVRCWRDLDRGVPATDLELRDRAIAQLDRALLRGMSILVRQRFAELTCRTKDERLALLEALRILVPLLDRETSERDPEKAAFLMAQIDKTPGEIDVQGALDALDTLYPCP